MRGPLVILRRYVPQYEVRFFRGADRLVRLNGRDDRRDRPEAVEFTADAGIIDQIIDWFGTDVRIMNTDDESRVRVSLRASPTAMEYWALQYLNFVEVTSPPHLRERIKKSLDGGMEKYK